MRMWWQRKQVRFTIYLGLADKDEREQRLSCERAVSLVGKVCQGYGVPFSVTLQQGGYVHQDGRYVLENSLAVSIIGLSRKVVDEVAKDLCSFLQQECVLIAQDKVALRTISDSIWTE